MILYYVRHGDPIYDPDSLTELGQKQAEALAKRFSLYGLDEVYSSPSNRAKLTAKPTCDALGLEMKICDWADEGLAGVDTGIKNKEGGFVWSFADKDMADKFNEPSVRALDKAWYTHPYFEGYPFEKGIKRIDAAVDDFLLSLGYKHDRENSRYEIVKKNDKRVALFAHQGFGLAFLSSLLDIPYPYVCNHFNLCHAGITIIDFPNKHGEVIVNLVQISMR